MRGRRYIDLPNGTVLDLYDYIVVSVVYLEPSAPVFC